jgi:hypothetical protein
LDYLVCRILGKTPEEVAELDEITVNFLKGGLLWEIGFAAKMGRPLLM